MIWKECEIDKKRWVWKKGGKMHYLFTSWQNNKKKLSLSFLIAKIPTYVVSCQVNKLNECAQISPSTF